MPSGQVSGHSNWLVPSTRGSSLSLGPVSHTPHSGRIPLVRPLGPAAPVYILRYPGPAAETHERVGSWERRGPDAASPRTRPAGAFDRSAVSDYRPGPAGTPAAEKELMGDSE